MERRQGFAWALARAAPGMGTRPVPADARMSAEADRKVEAGSPSGPEGALRTGDYDEAAEGFKKMLAAGAGSVAAARGLASALSAQGKHAEALAAIQSAKDHAPSAPLLAAAGRIHLLRGALGEAESAFRAALAIDKESVEALNRLGETLSKKGKLEEAKAAWNDVVGIYERMSSDAAEEVSPEDCRDGARAQSPTASRRRTTSCSRVPATRTRRTRRSSPNRAIFLAKYNYPDSRDYLKGATTRTGACRRPSTRRQLPRRLQVG